MRKEILLLGAITVIAVGVYVIHKNQQKMIAIQYQVLNQMTLNNQQQLQNAETQRLIQAERTPVGFKTAA